MKNKIRLALSLLALSIVSRHALAADPGAYVVTKLFVDACIPNMGHPERVRAWASDHRLPEVLDPFWLGVFVGPGGNGAAWLITTDVGKFALSIRGKTQGCAAWARAADPGETLSNFKKLIEGARRPGVKLSVDQDLVTQGQSGEIHSLSYNITALNAPTSFEFVLLTAERVGGPFQASMEVAAAGPHP